MFFRNFILLVRFVFGMKYLIIELILAILSFPLFFLFVSFFSKCFLYTYRLAHFYTYSNKIERLHIQDIYKMFHENALCLLLNTSKIQQYLFIGCVYGWNDFAKIESIIVSCLLEDWTKLHEYFVIWSVIYFMWTFSFFLSSIFYKQWNIFDRTRRKRMDWLYASLTQIIIVNDLN